MGMNLYVGNLAYDITDVDLREAFTPLGNVVSTKIIIDKHTGQSRGFGFVEFSTRAEGENAITAMQGKPLRNRNITINEARPPETRPLGERRNQFGGNRDSRNNRSQNYGNRNQADDNHGNRMSYDQRGNREDSGVLYQPSVERTYN